MFLTIPYNDGMKQIIMLLMMLVPYLNASALTLLPNKASVVMSGLNHPWSIVFLAQNKQLISQRNGDLLLINKHQKIPLKLPIDDIYASGQGGLLDLALDPNDNKTRWIYLSYSKRNSENDATTALVRFQLKNQKISNWQNLYTAKPYLDTSVHFGGRIAFDKQGYLYLSVGDRGNRKLAQNTNNDIGKILRLNPEGSTPEDNPFNNAIYSYGHRNPQGLIFFNKQLISHEHGPRGGDEINIIEPNKNYGWPIISYGKEYFSFRQVGIGTHKDGMQQPIHQWTPSIAPSGLSAIQNKDDTTTLFIGSLKFQRLHQLTLKNNQILSEQTHLNQQFGRIRDARIHNNHLYLLTDDGAGKLVSIPIVQK